MYKINENQFVRSWVFFFSNLYLLFRHITEWNNRWNGSMVVLWRKSYFCFSFTSSLHINTSMQCTRKRQLLLACVIIFPCLVKLMFIYLHTIGTSSASLTLLICQVNKRQSLYSGKIYIAFYLSSKIYMDQEKLA